ncbi:MAG: MFS transporter [Polyangiaceae bacterium]|nr:MFS transporter [Polyangiaceae bacterium]MCW5788916.1 MFS transporter [Polyangiaceae bacterium]
MRRTNRPVTVVALLLALFMAALEMTVVSTAMPTVVGELGGLERYSWVFTAYLLTATLTLPIYGKLADLYGRKPILLFGLLLFLAGSVASGQAQSIEQLICFRALQGLGAGAMQPVTMTIVGDLFDVQQRARMQGLFGSVWGAAGIAGPIAGGYIVTHWSWRWVFYVNVPVGIVCVMVLAFAYHESLERRRRPFDVLGVVLLSAALLLLLWVSELGLAGLHYLPLAFGLLVWLVFVERRAPEPMLPLPLFQRRIMWVGSLLGLLLGGAMLAVVTYVPLKVQALLGGSPEQAGRAVAPMLVGWPLASAVSGRLLGRLGYRPLVLAGVSLIALVSGAMAVLSGRLLTVLELGVMTGAFGVGMGLFNTVVIIAVQSSVSWEERGVATASLLFSRTIGGALVVGVVGGVLTRRLASVEGLPPGAADALLGPTHGHGLAPNVLQQLSGALGAGLQIAFWLVAALAALAWGIGLLFPRVKLDPSGPAPVDQRQAPA